MEITYDILANSKPLKDNIFQTEMLDFLFRHFTCFDKYFVFLLFTKNTSFIHINLYTYIQV